LHFLENALLSNIFPKFFAFLDVLFFEKTVFIASSSVYRQIIKEIKNFNRNNFNAIKKNLIVD